MFICPRCRERKMIEIEDTDHFLICIDNKNIFKKILVCTHCKYKVSKELFNSV